MANPRISLPNSLKDKSSIWIGVKLGVIIFSVLALFWGDLRIVFANAFQSEATSYILAVPVILAYFLYRKRKMLTAVIPIENGTHKKKLKIISTTAGLLMFATAVLFYWYGSYTFTPIEYHMVALPILTAALTILLFNIETLRQLAFPIIFLFFLTPPPSEILYAIGGMLSTLSSQAASVIATTIGIPSTLITEYGNPVIAIIRPDGAQLQFTVDVACSGIYSLIGFLMFSILITYIIRDKLWKKAALILVGIPLIYFLNVVRITVILGIGFHFGEDLALQVFHTIGGWFLTFIGTLFLLAISEKIFKTQIFAKASEGCSECHPINQDKYTFCSVCGKVLKTTRIKFRIGDVFKISAIIAVVALLLFVQAPVFALTQSPASVVFNTSTGQQGSTEILPNVPDYQLEFDYRDTEFEQLAKQDMSLAYVYYPLKASLQPIYVSIEIASTLNSLHRWETCLVEYPLSHGYSRATQVELYDIQLSENPHIIGRNFVFEYTQTGQTQAVLYWYETAIFNVNSTAQQKHVKISVIGYPTDTENLSVLKTQQLSIAKSIIDYWEPIKIGSTISLIVSENGAYLTGVTSILLIITAVYYTTEIIRQRKANKKAYGKLSTSNKQLIDAIRETEKISTPTLTQIGTKYQEATDQHVSDVQLLQKLEWLEKEGIIEKQIKNHRDEPIVTWKA